MSRTFPLALLTTLLLAASVSANAGPPPLPKGHKIIEPAVRFEGIDKHADHVFYLYYHAYYFEGVRAEVKDASAVKVAFKLRGDRVPVVSYIALLAMQRTDFEKRKKDDPSLQWLAVETAGVLEAKLTPPDTTAPIESKEIPATTYRVTLKDGKLRGEKMEAGKKGAAESSLLMPTWMFGIVSSLSIAWFGLWFARRKNASHG